MPIVPLTLETVLQQFVSRNQANGPDVWAGILRPFMEAQGITTNKRIAAFIGQVAVESAHFTHFEENLNYSATRLHAVWPNRFPSFESAQHFQYQPEAIANRVYFGRMGNVEEADGWRFRGGGLIQLTGRENYTRFGQALGKSAEDAAIYARTLTGAAHSACWFWGDRELNDLADTWQITNMTKRINGGTNGLAERLQACNTALSVLEHN